MTHQTTPARLVLDSPCPECGGGYLQDYRAGPEIIPHENGCEVYDDILNRLATAIAYGVLLAAVAEYGVTRRAVRATQLAIIGSDAFDPQHGAWCACVPSECPANERSPDAGTVRDG